MKNINFFYPLNIVKNIIFKEKKNKFIGYVYPISKKTEIKKIITVIYKLNKNSNQCCYAYRIFNPFSYGYNDDKEPNNTAGLFLYKEIVYKNIINILLVVFRFFKKKLGKGGLIRAYKNCAKKTLQNVYLYKKNIYIKYILILEYNEIKKGIFKILNKHKINIFKQKFNNHKYKIYISLKKEKIKLLKVSLKKFKIFFLKKK
jgi:putative IMPACT (imprinted ancient) family translation regulator